MEKDELLIWVYILHRSDGKFYTGITKNLDLRLHQHNSGQVISTRASKGVVCVYHEIRYGYLKAHKLEKEIKKKGAYKWLRRATFDGYLFKAKEAKINTIHLYQKKIVLPYHLIATVNKF